MQKKCYILIIFLLINCWSFSQLELSVENALDIKINGLNLDSSTNRSDRQFIKPIEEVNANWISLIPFAYGSNDSPKIEYPVKEQPWIGSEEGIRFAVKRAKKKGMKIMMKPMVVVPDYGWVGDFALETEEDWQTWEKNYETYILPLAKLSEELGVELFCIGTEYHQAVKLRSIFWGRLIDKVRAVYSGELTYAANWDNFEHVYFWRDLDYIGVDAYFPLTPEDTPSVELLRGAWKRYKDKLFEFSQFHGRPILFTEFGYRSINRAMWRQWELDEPYQDQTPNMEAQFNGYVAIFEEFWQESWFAGGFIWKWYTEHNTAGGSANNRYTPQRKLVEEEIKAWYSNQR